MPIYSSQKLSNGNLVRIPYIRTGTEGMDKIPTIIPTTNLKFWFDADATYITKDGSNYVSAWADRSGNGNNLSQGSGSYQPLWQASQINGYPALYFNVDGMNTAAFTFNQPFTIYVVLKGLSGGYYDSVFEGLTGYSYIMLNKSGTGYYNMNAGSNFTTSIPFSYNSYDIAVACFNGSSSFVKENGGTKQTGNPGSNNAGGFAIGFRGGSYQFVGYIAEIIGYDAAHNDSQVATLQTYLNDKYSVY